ncbi:sensor histidine kinase [Streptosporangium longisporum]|uniref:histidine kinase n=1 Tax=Streptosporangium longisporum TaxID=46187 RepID=A0ABN3YA30_9ACTN
MVRYVLVVAVAVADTALLWLDGAGGWTLAAYAVSVASVMAAVDRLPFAAFLAALALAVFTGGSLALLVCTGFHAGHRVRTRSDVVVTAVVLAAYVGVVLMVAQRAPGGQEPWTVLARVAVLTVLPLLAGRYLVRQREQLRRERDLVAERERLRISRDMHDSLGHLLSLVSVRAAALEAGPLPADQRRAVHGLAAAARTAAAELHHVVGTLRRHEGPGLEGIDGLVARLRAAGVAVTAETSGRSVPLPGEDVARAAYRVVQEGLTNAVRHAPGAPVTLSLDWQPDALLVTVANLVPRRAPTGETGGTGPAGETGGTGLAGLSERVGAAGGLLRVRSEPHEFRLVAMLPLAPAATGAAA